MSVGASWPEIVAVTVAVCAGAPPSLKDTVKPPAAPLPSCWNETRLAARSACVKLAVAAPLRRTTPCVVPVTVYTSSAGVLSTSLAVRSAVVTATAPPFVTLIASSPPSTGASLTGATVMATDAVLLSRAPSVALKLKLSVPLKSAAGV